MNHTTSLITLILLTIISAFFSAAETGMMALNRYRLKHMVKKGNITAKRVYSLINQPDKLLSTILIGNTFANLLFSSIFTQWAIVQFGELNILQSILLTIVSSIVLLIFAESTPKTFAAMLPQNVAFYSSLPLKILLFVLYPLVWFITTIGNGLLRLVGVNIKQHHRHTDPLSHEELRTLVYESKDQFPAQNTTMLIRLLDLNYDVVEDAMIPRNEIATININDEWHEIQKQILAWPYSDLLFVNDNIENILGVMHIKKVLNLINKQQLSKEQIKENLEECYFIPESTTLAAQLLNFQTSHKKSGLIVDEYGDITGLISLQDILEEVVGAFDQYNTHYGQEILPQKDGSVLIEGSANIREINRELNWELPEEGPKTLSGLIIEQLEHIPADLSCLKISNYKIEVLKIHKNMIKQVRIFVGD